MTDEKSQDDLLDRQLREAAPYIEDAGFTARVLRQLPAPRPQAQFVRPFILLGTSLLASVLAYFLSDGGRFLLVEMVRLSALPAMWLCVLVLASGILVMTGGLAAAMSKASRINS
jgi:hypothetical protein